ncbi:zinc-dependent alcohol dehydrogenase family protein [Temperatibacter marinus]|uniref:Zinc-dependent alcohol dehydrogenase family protein n=1 Tax=Temperatibacter marinus TaxID=1456591 RepID=A0AA52EFZ6_9PROT|nr:zinc-dependent alcohol dehydrogenase family protein [Temperatibacter marinus]WND02983.1 zinc-dependent alcohol dehydrogenase family protein [Temperatibacter marinus]
MKTMALNEYGAEAKFQKLEIETPTVKEGHVQVRIAASSVNTVDTMIRQMGTDLPLSPQLPAILGMDFAGIVTAISDDVSGFSIGDEVYGCAGGLADLQGSLAEYMVVDADLIAHKPKSLTMKQAAALPLVGITAFEGLQRANISQHQKALIHGGAGGVGHVAVQLAKHWGADVYSTISDEKQADIIQSYGATPINYITEEVADYVDQHTGGHGFDLIFDSVGGANMTNSFEAASLNANIATTVAMLDIDLTPAHFKGLSIHVVFMLIPMLHNYKRKDHANTLQELSTIIDAGGLIPLLDEESFHFDAVDKAYERLSSGKAIGKVVIEI